MPQRQLRVESELGVQGGREAGREPGRQQLNSFTRQPVHQNGNRSRFDVGVAVGGGVASSASLSPSSG